MSPELLLIPLVTFAAGLIRGFTGFGGPAFILAMLTWAYSPLVVIGKILVIEFIAASYLMVQTRKTIDWRTTLAITIPTLLTMPLGHWVLEHTEPELMRKLIAGAIFLSCLLMAIGLRYQQRLRVVASVSLGFAGGVIFGASYMALPVVAVILMGPYEKHEIRALVVSWGFLTAAWFIAISVFSGTTGVQQVINAMPAAVTYFAGTWTGSQFFSRSGEEVYRRVALFTLMFLSVLGFAL